MKPTALAAVACRSTRNLWLAATGFAVVATLLAGCGAGTSNTGSQRRSLGGFALDGYIADAEIRCLGTDGQRLASARTAGNGAWILRLPSGVQTCKSLEVYEGVDVGTSAANPAERSVLPPGTRFTANLSHLDASRLGNTPVIVSPLTSLIDILQSSSGLSATAARSTVMLGLGLPDSFDPLFENPISLRQSNVFGAGLLAATAIREISAGIIDTLASDSSLNITIEARRNINRRVTESLAEFIRTGRITRQAFSNREPLPESSLVQLTHNALTRLQAELPLTGVQIDTVSTIVSQYVGRSGADLEGAIATSDLSQIAQRSSALNTAGQADLQRPQLLQKLATEANLDLPALAREVRTVMANPSHRPEIARTNGAAPLVLELSETLKDYLQVAGEQLRFYTSTDTTTGRAISVSDFEFGKAAPLSGALSGVALSFTQPLGSALLSASSEKTVKLGFRVERLDPLGVMNIRLAAIVDGVKLQWSDKGLVARIPDDVVLYGAVRIGSSSTDTPLTIVNSNNRLASLISTENGLLRIDLAAFITALGLNPDSILQSYLSNGDLTVEAVISNLVFARGQGSSVRKLGEISVSVFRDTGDLTAIGAGLRGTVTSGP
jgi:hypothetical protein